MSEGSLPRALVWSLAVAATLLAWPWLLAWLRDRRPTWFTGTEVTGLATLRRGLAGDDAPGAATFVGWSILVAAAAVLPATRGLFAADLDAGLLWLAALPLLALPWSDDRARHQAAGGLLTLTLCLLPVVLRSASLDLADLAVAQQGGVGNWYLLRDPFLLLAGLVYLLTVASLWPAPPPPGATGTRLLLDAALRTGVPLVLAQLFVVAFLGGWWAFTVVLDGAALVNTALKTLVVVALVLTLRRRTEMGHRRQLELLLPLAALVCAAGSGLWMTLSGAAW